MCHDTKHCIVTGARAWMARGLCRDTPFCIVTEARGGPLGARSRYKIVSWLSGGDHVSRYNKLYRDRRRLDWLRCVTIQSFVS